MIIKKKNKQTQYNTKNCKCVRVKKNTTHVKSFTWLSLGVEERTLPPLYFKYVSFRCVYL